MPPLSLAGPMAEELHAMALATERLAEQLCADPAVALHCLPLLQQFDHLAQQQAELGALLMRLGQGVQPAEAVGKIRLAALAERLGKAA